jgi:putative transposase
MPRTARATGGGFCYHLLNRGNARNQAFHHEGDYASFVQLIRQACARFPMRVLAYCLMPNHIHLTVWPQGGRDLSKWMHWLWTAHVRSYRKQYRGSGHIWQGRFKAFPVQEDDHLLTVLRYIECNPLRAGLVNRAEEWPWSSLYAGVAAPLLPVLDPGPVPRPPGWVDHVNTPLHEKDLTRLRHSVRRGAPFGQSDWTKATAAQLGLEDTLRPPGRPLKSSGADTSRLPPDLFPENN